MADDVVPDRLAEVERLRDELAVATEVAEVALSDLRLHADLPERVAIAVSNVALRGALQALVDATDNLPETWGIYDAARAARAVAVAVLTGQEPT